MNDITISIIIPVFNAEEYLNECLSGIQSQTFQDWECICVDDGSTDQSQCIVGEFVSKDPRFRLIEQANGGPGVARNTGLAAATGRYFTFVDADDLVHPQMLEKLLELARLHGADLVSCGYFHFKSDEEFQAFIQGLEFEEASPDIEDAPLLPNMIDWKKYRTHPFGRLHQMDQHSELKFPSLYGSEDTYASFDVYARSKSAVFINTPFYGYRTVGSSLTNSEIKYRNYMIGDAAVAIHCEEVCREQRVDKAVTKQLFMTYVMRIFHYNNEMALDGRVPREEKKELMGIAKKGLAEIKRSVARRYRIVPPVHFVPYLAIQLRSLWLLILWQRFKVFVLRNMFR